VPPQGRGRLAAAPSPATLESSAQILLKLLRASHTSWYASQNDVSKRLVKIEQIKLWSLKLIKCHIKIKNIIKEGIPYDFSGHIP